MLIVTETQTSEVEYLVNTDDDKVARQLFEDGICEKIDRNPVLLNSSIKVRKLNEKDEREFLVRKAQSLIETEQVEAPVKKRKPRTSAKADRKEAVDFLMEQLNDA